jgi:type III secretion system FlhB-like substrate exporter
VEPSPSVPPQTCSTGHAHRAENVVGSDERDGDVLAYNRVLVLSLRRFELETGLV